MQLGSKSRSQQNGHVPTGTYRSLGTALKEKCCLAGNGLSSASSPWELASLGHPGGRSLSRLSTTSSQPAPLYKPLSREGLFRVGAGTRTWLNDTKLNVWR